MKHIRILIVDDHAVVRLGLAALFKYQKDLKVVGDADDGESAIAMAPDLRPDVVILDLMMPGIGVVETVRRLREVLPSVNILIFTSFGTSGELANVLKAGASGAILKGASNEELLSAIRKVANGERVLSPKIEEFINESPEIPQFTKRQTEILESVTRGFSNPDIAKQLGISTDAVKQHLNAIYQKLDVTTRTEAITAALRRQLLKI
jgi:NarL family two-component system response regulator LiaR